VRQAFASAAPQELLRTGVEARSTVPARLEALAAEAGKFVDRNQRQKRADNSQLELPLWPGSLSFFCSWSLQMSDKFHRLNFVRTNIYFPSVLHQFLMAILALAQHVRNKQIAVPIVGGRVRFHAKPAPYLCSVLECHDNPAFKTLRKQGIPSGRRVALFESFPTEIRENLSIITFLTKPAPKRSIQNRLNERY
jgi:hypothetical protein